MTDDDMRPSPSPIEITLLGDLTVSVLVPGTDVRYPAWLERRSITHQLLIAYLAWRQGDIVMHDVLRRAIYGDQNAKKAQNLLDTDKKEVRRRLFAASVRAKMENEKTIFPAVLDVFEVEGRRYSLHSDCHVSDLRILDTQYAILEQAYKQHLLFTTIALPVFEACKAMIDAYTGSFLEKLIVQNASLLTSEEARWIEEPYTLYKHRYLQAAFYAGEYVRQHVPALTKTNRPHRTKMYHEAASFYARGALASCRNHVSDILFDSLFSFSEHQGLELGAHILLGEQMLRLALFCYNAAENAMLANETYSRFQQQMLRASNGVWRPSAETVLAYNTIQEKMQSFRL